MGRVFVLELFFEANDPSISGLLTSTKAFKPGSSLYSLTLVESRVAGLRSSVFGLRFVVTHIVDEEIYLSKTINAKRTNSYR